MKYTNNAFNNLQKRPGGYFNGPTPENLFRDAEPYYMKILDRFSGLYAKLGVPYEQLRLLVKVRMGVNERVQQEIADRMNRNQGKSKGKRFGYTVGILLQLLLAVLLATPILMFKDYTTAFFLVYTVLGILLLLNLVPQMSQVLMSAADATLLPAFPISAKILSLAKVTQILIYFLQGLALMIGPALVFGFIKHNPLIGLLNVVCLLVFSVFLLFFSLALYLLLSKWFSGEFLRNMVAYIQIFMTLATMIIYQLLGRVFSLFSNIRIDYSWWQLVYPPAWFVAPFYLIKNGVHPIYLAAMALGLLALAFLLVYYWRGAARLEKKLQDAAIELDGQKKDRGMLRRFWGKVLCPNVSERSFFHFCWQLMKYERSFKMAVYPILGIYSILPYVLALGSKDSGANLVSMYTYMNLAIVPVLVAECQKSDYWAAGWIFYVSPVPSVRLSLKALTKVIWSKLYLPLFLPQILIQYYSFGPRAMLSTIIMFLLLYPFLIVGTKIRKFYEPFTMPRTNENSSYVTSFFVFIVFAVALGVLEMVVLSWNFSVVYYYISILLVLNLLLLYLPVKGQKQALTEAR